MDFDKNKKEFKNFIYGRQKQNFLRCFWPKSKCSREAIRAHSVQNNGVLDKISVKGHVTMLKAKQNLETGPKINFIEIGRNDATTFTGLCNEHDTLIFNPIDNSPIDTNNPEHLFLLAYRSVLRELHSKMAGAVITQQIYNKGVDLGHFDPNKVDPAMQTATMGIAEAYSCYLYKFQYDLIYVKKEFNKLQHHVIKIKNQSPLVAVSAVYDLFDNMRKLEDRHDPKCICLNVFPQDGCLFVVYSYKKEQIDTFYSHVKELEQATDEYQLYMLSKRILMFSENFILNPELVEKWTDSKKNDIITYYSENLTTKREYDNKDLFLFEN